MNIYLKKNVWDAAQERVAWVFDEFENVIVGMSGGKDSSIVYHLALMEAEKRGRLPLKVFWLDQEAEWKMTEDYVKTIMYDKRVDPYWFQIPFKINNATSHTTENLEIWGEGQEWMREQDPISYKENIYGTDDFYKLFNAITDYHFKGQNLALLGGLRTEESPTRFIALTGALTYKNVTWGKILNKKDDHYTFYPIYDWTYMDVWKAIHDNGWAYNKVYDYMYQHGYSIRDMRVSNLHHETALKHLLFMQEIERDTWVALSKRLQGINTVKHLSKASMTCPKELPDAFESWMEYRDYLTENLCPDEESKTFFRKKFDHMEEKYHDIKSKDEMYKAHIKTILVNDKEFTKLGNWENNFEVVAWRKWKNHGKLPPVKNKYIHG